MEIGMRLQALTANPGSRAWLKVAALTLFVGIVDCLAVFFAKRPVLYTAIIPALLPLLSVPLVIIPLLNDKKK